MSEGRYADSEDFPDGAVETVVCTECGAVVALKQAHDRFHAPPPEVMQVGR